MTTNFYLNSEMWEIQQHAVIKQLLYNITFYITFYINFGDWSFRVGRRVHDIAQPRTVQRSSSTQHLLLPIMT